MVRVKGTIPSSENIEPQKAAPLDARAIADTYESLLLEDTWKSLDDESYVYPGMVVSVHDDVDKTKNGLYFLLRLPTSVATNWLKLIDNNIVATDEEYDEGTSKTKVPSVAQVKNSLTEKQNNLNLVVTTDPDSSLRRGTLTL